ncbi:MAG TPA: cation:proton antiporter [archaeon]|nr:cation:proton antiporter [archaeon]
MALIDIFIQFALILVAGVIIKAIGDKANFPFIVLLMLSGTALASLSLIEIFSLDFVPELIRTIALISIVFSSGFFINLKDVFKQTKLILSLSFFGSILTAFITTVISFWFLSLPLVSAALLGTLWSGSDAAAFPQAKKKSNILNILRTESVLNTPLSVILPFFILDFLLKANTSSDVFLFFIFSDNISKFFSLIVVGAVSGIAMYVLGQYVLKHSNHDYIEVVALTIAFTSYVLTEILGGSGILAVGLTSILLANSRIPEKKMLGEFNSQLSFFFTVLVFVLLGAEFVFSDFFLISFFDLIAIIFVLFFARLLSALILLRNSNLSFDEKLKIGLISPKGVAPAALAPLILNPLYGVIEAEKIVVIIYVGIIVSVLISLLVLQFFVLNERKSLA